ncbi:FAD-dependent monooxygenase [Saccharothrix sp. ST-888]|uniref:FAD-dependent monooxygenase n=1 Tax=Saccharothrix sp. ST-888 TaxID=1427391 RepID=UPI0018CD97D6|nr:FAD-dependent monooxygenase [Saccharothrix sp. ST-888]
MNVNESSMNENTSSPAPHGAAPDRTSVLIVGGSIVGVSAALFLAARGVTPILVERHTGISPRLRAKLFYPRTMEAYRAVGAADDIYAIERDRPRSEFAAVVESLAGAEIRRWRLPAAEDHSAVSPCQGAMVKQGDAERVLRTRAAADGADLRFGHRFVDWEQNAHRVTARVLDDRSVPYTVEADYLLAADGSASSIRERLGIAQRGDLTLAHSMELAFNADLRPVLEGRALALAFADQPGRPFISWTTEQDTGAVSVGYDPATTDPDTAFTPDRCQAVVSAALGLPASAFRITGARPWQMSAWVAGTYREGRVFLVGDAAHVCPPVGGFGANTGIQDAWNLTAKLVSVLRGHAGAGLLDRYEPERRPVAELTVRQSVQRLAGAREQVSGGGQLLSEAAVAGGYRYPAPVVDAVGSSAGTPLPWADEPDRWRAEPGTRLPHRPLEAAAGSSTLDLVRGGRHALLTGRQGWSWAEAARALDPDHAVLDTVVLTPQALAPGASFTDRCGIGEDGAVLVRPDGVVCWRAAHAARAPHAVLKDVLQQALLQ